MNKKIETLKDRLKELESVLLAALTKKASGKAEVDVASITSQIAETRKQIDLAEWAFSLTLGAGRPMNPKY